MRRARGAYNRMSIQLLVIVNIFAQQFPSSVKLDFFETRDSGREIEYFPYFGRP